MVKPLTARKPDSASAPAKANAANSHQQAWDKRQRAFDRLEAAVQMGDVDYYGSQWARHIGDFLREAQPLDPNWLKSAGQRPGDSHEDHWRMAMEMARMAADGQCDKAAVIVESLRANNYTTWVEVRHCAWIFMGQVLAKSREVLQRLAVKEGAGTLPRKEWHPFYCALRGTAVAARS